MKEKITSPHKWAAEKNKKSYPCVCGCGSDIKVKWHHKYEGIPKYINGHSPPNLVDLGNGKTRKIWGGRFDQSARSAKRNYYYARVNFESKGYSLNVGMDLKLARKFVFAFYKASKNQLHYYTIVRLMEMVIKRAKKDFTRLENARVDKSLFEAKKAIIELRKMVKKKIKEA